MSYKVITKLLAQRLQSVMENIVGAVQCSFVPARQSGDNITIAQEVISSMRSRKRHKGWMAIKIDLEAAYDHLIIREFVGGYWVAIAL